MIIKPVIAIFTRVKSLKIRLNLTDKQATLCRQHAGVARHAYNWGVAECQQAFEQKQKIPSAIDLHKRLVAEVKTEHSWYYKVSKCAPQQRPCVTCNQLTSRFIESRNHRATNSAKPFAEEEKS